MWYFAWILGTALALCFGVLNAIWYEMLATQQVSGETPPRSDAPD